MQHEFACFTEGFWPNFEEYRILCPLGLDLLGSHNSYRIFIKYCVFSKILKYSGLLHFSVFPRCHCVYTHKAGRTPALQQNWQSSEKSQNFKEKTHFLMNTLYLLLLPFKWKVNRTKWRKKNNSHKLSITLFQTDIIEHCKKKVHQFKNK